LFKTASSNELNIDTVLNKYGIKTEYAGNLHLNLNVVIQNKDVMEKARNEVKRMQPISDFNLTYGITPATKETLDFLPASKSAAFSS